MADKQYTKEKCENCGYKYNCYGTFGGHCICNRCYSLWYENIKLKEENLKLSHEICLLPCPCVACPCRNLELIEENSELSIEGKLVENKYAN